MLVINYNGNKPITDYFKFSVQGNNNADKIRFLVSLNQSGLVFDNNYHIYAKVQCVDDDFYDKVELSEINFDDSNNLLDVYFSLEAKHTSHKQIEVSLSCEDLNNEIVWQTAIVKLAIMGGVNADEEIANTYPSILAQLQKQIDELKQQGGGGGASSVEIEKVWLTYDDGMSIRNDFLALSLLGNPFTNDSTRIWVNFKTTPINAQMEEEIKKGRFVIRLDYPIKNNIRLTTSKNSPIRPTPQEKFGAGTRAFAYNFIGQGRYSMSNKKKEILLNSLIFVNEEDIMTNAYGEKYIHKKISLFDYINNSCSAFSSKGTPDKSTLEPITNDWIRNDVNGQDFFNNYFNEFFSLGIPHLKQNGLVLNEEDSERLYDGTKLNKFFDGTAYWSGLTQRQLSIRTSSSKLNPAFSCYTTLKTNVVVHYLYSPFFISNKKGYKYEWTRHSQLVAGGSIGRKLTRKMYMSVKPRCAILSDDYLTTTANAFIKTYPQCDQQIRLLCKAICDVDEYSVGSAPVFRMSITQK